ncbi:MAG: ATP-binding protein [Thermodesulfobacteriota bacterium]|nr:ATP-binding protein [Thermodesulfobacteriota bacterium]
MVKVGEILNSLRYSVAGKFILFMLLVSSIITFIGTGVQLYIDYSRDRESIRDTFRQIDVSYRQSIANTMWVSNMDALKMQLQGILKLRNMQYLEVELEDKSLIRVGSPETKHILTREYILSHGFRGREIYLGTMRVTASLRGVYERLLNKVSIIFLIQTAHVFVVAFFILFLFYILVGRHLHTLAQYVRSFDLENPGTPLRLRRYPEKYNEKNELSVLAHSVNEMRMDLIDKIKKRDQAEALLREREESYHLLITEMSAGFALHEVLCKEDGTPYDYRFIEVNAAFEKIVGIERERILGKTVLGLLPSLEKYWVDTYAEVITTGNPATFERYLKELDRCLYVVAYVPQKGRFAVIVQDISERKRAEEELKEHKDHLEEMVNERTAELRHAQERLLASERLATLGKFAGSVSHELRNPLAVIGSSVYYLKKKLNDPDQKTMTHLDRISRQVKYSTAIMESLLDLTRMKSLRKEKLDLAVLLNEAISESRIPKTIRVQREMKEGVLVYGDSQQLHMTFRNIIKNAVDAMNEDGTLTVGLEVSEDGEFTETLIKDTGSGIDPEHIPEIFDPLFTTKSRGIGFGLSISQQIVDRHGGFIDVVSEPEKGSSFVVKLPTQARNQSTEVERVEKPFTEML